MGYNLVITAKAEADLDDIVSYIINDLCNIPAAINLIDEITERYSIIENTPFVYPLCRQPLLSSRFYRKVIINSYLMIFRVDEATATVYIERFFSQIQSYEDMI